MKLQKKEAEHELWNNGSLRTQIYYYDAGCLHQKGAIEVNHGLIRRVLPKGTSLNYLTQEEITRMIDHINSYKKKLNNRSLYETFSLCHGEEVLEKLGTTTNDLYDPPQG